MNEIEKDLVFSEAVKAGKRIYYFDVKQTRNGDRYVSITESKKIVEGSYENPKVSFEKHKLFLYKEDYEKFVGALLRTVDVAKSNTIPVPEIYPSDEVSEVEVANEPEIKSEPAVAIPPVAEETVDAATEQPVSPSEKEDDGFKIDLDF